MENNINGVVFVEERKKFIVEYINKNAKATVSELCSNFSVSSGTIRNDLKELAERGLIKRTHGGAIANTSVNFELNSDEKEVIKISAKEAIARSALKHIHEGDSIVLDAGTTTYELAKLLISFKKLTVVTYDLNIASFLDNNSKINVIMAGGLIRRGFHYTAGEMAIATIRDLNFDVAFIAANGINIERGLTTPDVETASIKQVMMSNAHKVILIADSAKLDTISFVKFSGCNQIDIFITDSDADPSFIQEMKKKEVITEVVEY